MSKTEQTIWDFWADRYEGLWAQHFSLRPSRELVHAHLEEVCPAQPRILDLGCGVGQFLSELSQRRPGAELLGFDAAESMIRRAWADYACPNVDYQVGTIWDVPAGDGYDIITSMHAFPYFPDKYGAMVRIRELLRPGGRVLLIQANTEDWYDRGFLKFVKLTTTSAEYLGAGELQQLMTRAGLQPGMIRPIDRFRFIPSIQLVEGIRV